MYQKIIEYRDYIKGEIEKLENEVKTAPKGKLICTKNGNSTKWYVRKNGVREYIPKDKRKYAESLARRRYAEEKIIALKKELYAIERYEIHRGDLLAVDQKYLCEPSKYRNLLINTVKPMDEASKVWMNETCEKNEKYKDTLTVEGEYDWSYRSKSEGLIEYALSKANIPYKYECPIVINGIKLYPDFTIRRPYDGKMIYWEHFGLMDDLDYIFNSFSKKISLYAKAGIFLGETLFVTFETKDSPIKISDVEYVMKKIMM